LCCLGEFLGEKAQNHAITKTRGSSRNVIENKGQIF
jgi:hypothetical protein